MKERSIAILIASAIIIAGILVTGCVQDAGRSSDQSTGTQAPPAAPQNNPVTAGQTNQQIQNAGIPGAGSQRHYQGQGFLSNVTVLTAAAEKLGVSEQDLQNALTSSGGGRQNLTAAAQQLGITRDQLAAALGIPAGNPGMRDGRNTTVTQTSSP